MSMFRARFWLSRMFGAWYWGPPVVHEPTIIYTYTIILKDSPTFNVSIPLTDTKDVTMVPTPTLVVSTTK